MGGIRNLYDDWSYGVLALLLYAQRGSDKYKPEGMARMRINEAESDDIEFQVKTIEMIVEAFCITTLPGMGIGQWSCRDFTSMSPPRPPAMPVSGKWRET